jgi:hypothetical protein
MSNYILVFRVENGRIPNAEQEAAWGQWFGQIGASIVDAGNRVGKATTLGNSAPGTVLGGYTVIKADDYDAAVAVAEGCPGLKYGGGVEVGEFVPAA